MESKLQKGCTYDANDQYIIYFPSRRLSFSGGDPSSCPCDDRPSPHGGGGHHHHQIHQSYQSAQKHSRCRLHVDESGNDAIPGRLVY